MSRSTAILAVCLTLVRLTSALQACISADGPGVCRCSGTTVNCDYKKLTAVPDDIPTSTTYLSLQHNHIVAIENTKLQHLKNLTRLYIDNNEITTITSHTFSGVRNIQRLYLDHNHISVVEPGSFQHLHVNRRLRLNDNHLETLPSTLCNSDDFYLSLYNNPWSCDCRMREILDCSNWNYRITCRSPPALDDTRLSSLTRDNLNCSSPTINNIGPKVHLARVGETVTLYCNATGFNRPTLTWSWTPVPPSSAPTDRKHYEVSTTNLGYNSAESTLTITHVQMVEQGQYTCHASNVAGDNLRSFSLFVVPTETETPPSNTGTPPSNTGAPPSNTGTPPSNTGTPPSNTGAPPSNTGTPSHLVVSTHSSTTLIGAAVGSFIGGILLCAIIGLILSIHKRGQAFGCLPRGSSSEEAQPESQNANRGTEHPNPAFQQDADEYEDVSVPQPRAPVYQNRPREPVTRGAQDGGEDEYENVGLSQPRAHVYQNRIRTKAVHAVAHGGQDGGTDEDEYENVACPQPKAHIYQNQTKPMHAVAHGTQDGRTDEDEYENVGLSQPKAHIYQNRTKQMHARRW
ncbi:LRRC24 [Branchiostoma lanceolatum]|uniref:LRRC24 protein n=1 Tax=Branchiostoma lanceolatum TaxID=7740 RepID=A0A8K0AAQ4_BRALA|nr:LRRC24 [Branchiostoma lanceolatum]